MTRFLSATIIATLLILCSNALAGQIWTDGNGDGLPDSGPIPATPGTNVTVGIWIDAQSFTWTAYLAYVEWTGCMSYVSAQYVITGGNNFPWTEDLPVAFGGSGFNEGGIDYVGNLTLRVGTMGNCCVTPVIDIYNPYYVFSHLLNGSSYMLFTSNPGTCWDTDTTPTGVPSSPIEPQAVELRSWGRSRTAL